MLTTEIEQMKKEAIERMKVLKLSRQIINDFITKNIIYVSNVKGNQEKANDKQMQLVKQYEEDRQIKIYHITHLKTKSREILYFHYVDNNKDNWKIEKRDLTLGFDDVICYRVSKEFRQVRLKIRQGIISFIS